jgi:hypothetical protein
MKSEILKMARSGLKKLKVSASQGGQLLAVPLRKFDAGAKFTVKLLPRSECDCAA